MRTGNKYNILSALPDKNISNKIKNLALGQGFSACGITKAENLGCETQFSAWLGNGYNAGLAYMERNRELRLNPKLFFEEAKSVIVCAINYKPKQWQNGNLPQIAAFAYGEDYHRVIKDKLEFICRETEKEAKGFAYRVFSDSAPLLERELARRAGLGWIGKNSNLIIPEAGSFILLGEIVCNLELDYDEPFVNEYCRSCRRCIQACPTGAIAGPKTIDARRCISYHTIESKDDIPDSIAAKLGKKFFGCDECLKACPYNKTTSGLSEKRFFPHPDYFSFSREDYLALSEDDFEKLFEKSSLKRAGLKKLQNTLIKNTENK